MTEQSDIAFTDSVKSIQARKGSRKSYERMYEQEVLTSGFETEITEELSAFIAELNSVFFATVNASGQPYIQHRGGPPGFIKVLDKNTLAFADYKGNRQFISQGNLLDNPKAFMFLIDYTQSRRIKVWGSAEIVEDDDELLAALMPPAGEYRAQAEQAVRFTVHTWDRNCPQHIPLRVDVTTIEQALKERDAEIVRLKQQIQSMS